MNAPLDASWTQRSKLRTATGPKMGWLAVAVFCYLLSGQPLGVRDPLGRSIGWYIYVELALFSLSIAIAVVVWARNGVRPRPPRSLWPFLSFGLIALFCSVRSFWPSLSIVQACLFLFVLILAELLCSTFPPAVVLRATYYSIVIVFIGGILVGLILPGIYPLAVLESGRHRLALFTYTHGDFAYMAGMGFFIGRLRAVRARWYFQALLVVLTIASGSRACTLALILVWAAIQVFGQRDFRLTLGLGALGGAAIIMGLVLAAVGLWGPGTPIHQGLQAFYGSKILDQSPWGLSGRLELWEASKGTFGKSALLGFGFEGARDQLLSAMPWAGVAHNAFLGLLLAAGGAGLVSFLAGWISAIRSCLRSKTGRSSFAFHCFLLLVSITGQSFTMFQYFGIFLVLGLHHWTNGLIFEKSEQIIQRSSNSAKHKKLVKAALGANTV